MVSLSSTRTKWYKKATYPSPGIPDSCTVCCPAYSNGSLEDPKEQGKSLCLVYVRVNSVNERKLEKVNAGKESKDNGKRKSQ